MLLEMYFLLSARASDYNRYMTCSQWAFCPQARALQSTVAAAGQKQKEGFSCTSFPTDWDRITITQWLGAHMQIIFLNKFIAVYSSYRHLFHNKKSTTIFIKLEVRWAGKKREKHILEWFLKPTLVSQTNGLDTALPAGRVLPSLGRAAERVAAALLLTAPSTVPLTRRYFSSGILGIGNYLYHLQVIQSWQFFH